MLLNCTWIPATIFAGIVHDVVEDTKYTLEDLRKEFGDEVAELVDGVTKIGAVHFNSYEEQQVDYSRKMLLSMAKDIRVILIKLADRMHNMRTLEALPPEKRQRIALETRDVYCPLAHRLGIHKLKEELEDLAFKYLEQDIYTDLAQRVKEKKAEREAYIDEVVAPIKDALAKDSIFATVYGRAKHLMSIHRKSDTAKFHLSKYTIFWRFASSSTVNGNVTTRWESFTQCGNRCRTDSTIISRFPSQMVIALCTLPCSDPRIKW